MKARMLLVDDESHIRSVLKRLLARRFPDLEVVEAASAEDALEVLSHESFDVILTDFRMDGATGADLLRQVSTDAPATARVLATGYQDDGIIEEAVKGLDLAARLPKPWDNEAVVAVLERILSDRARAVETPGGGASAATRK